MRKCATELMKDLKWIACDIADLHEKDKRLSYGQPDDAKYYDYNKVRKMLEEDYAIERLIKYRLNKFNTETLVEGYDFTMAIGLMKIGQLKQEIAVLDELAGKKVIDSRIESTYGYNDGRRYVIFYDIEKARADLRAKQHELSLLQIAIDRTNLNSYIEIEEIEEAE